MSAPLAASRRTDMSKKFLIEMAVGAFMAVVWTACVVVF
jgi:hypothetical protein